MTKPSIWGELIKQLREEQGLSQRKLAAKAGIGRSIIRSIEVGEGYAEFGITALERTLNVLGYELDAVKTRDVEPRKRPHILT